uniref:P-type ATPase A domain-containing protein n=1 Tax=Callorhinchus milii TaxID=7868 RepID=A0A4W3I8D4_CALMI
MSEVEVLSSQLVPGDLFLVTGNKRVLPCDAVLIQGGCIVNESMLTGESVPVTKTPLPSVAGPTSWWSSSADHKLHLLFCGTQVIQTKTGSQGEVKAVVHRTGFSTAKGELVRSILYPKPMDFKLYQDAFRFLMCLGVIAILGMIYTICNNPFKNKQQFGHSALDVITIAVSPALPASITVGIIYSTRRLKKKGIFCISPQRINVCGQLNLVCFDKTGTLTEEGLDLWGLSIFRFSGRDILPWGPFFGALASCHSLSLSDNNLQGDPLDLKMFEATCWREWEGSLSPVTNLPFQEFCMLQESVQGIIVLNQFPFSSALQRMSVVTQLVGRDKFTVYLKGAPETVAALCIPTTVPRTFSTELQRYTTQGFRVIGFLLSRVKLLFVVIVREEVESDLVFLGFLILENKLKSQTIPVLEELLRARIRTVMITGKGRAFSPDPADCPCLNPSPRCSAFISRLAPSSDRTGRLFHRVYGHLTSLYLALNYSIVKRFKTQPHMDNFEKKRNFHFALSGKSFDVLLQHFYHLLPKILVNATVFARMSPSQKGSLIQEFQNYCVGMCGDGANDCGALKNAHAGISLSKYEASVSSPFTSNIDNIECVTVLIKEGRAALVTSFCMFKFMAIYSMIQYLAVLLLYWVCLTFFKSIIQRLRKLLILSTIQ